MVPQKRLFPILYFVFILAMFVLTGLVNFERSSKVDELPVALAGLPGVTNEWWRSVKENFLQSKPYMGPFTSILTGTGEILPETPSWMFESDQSDSDFASSASSVGDLNGDGYYDVVIGARFYNTSEGRVFVFYGSPSGLSLTPDWIAGDNNGAGNLGRSVSAAGDVNGDGYDDLVVSRPLGPGWVFVYYGGQGGLSCGSGCPVDAMAAADWIAISGESNSRFGRSVSTAGDVNDDGYDDILIGAWLYNNDQIDEGRVYAFYGSAIGLSCGSGCPVNADNTADWIVESNQDSAYLGVHLASTGDVNGDNYDDVILGAANFDNTPNNEGMAFVYYGSAGGLSCGAGCPADAMSTADWSVESNQLRAYLGQVSGAGDVNGDGYDDVLVGAQYNNGDKDEGMAFVFHGSINGLSCENGCPVDALTMADWSVESNQIDSNLAGGVGSSASIGDINDDGYDDIIIGALRFDNSEVDEGLAFVFLGSMTGISCGQGCPVDALLAADWMGELNNPGALFGSVVDGAGDVNGDGSMDVIVGAPSYTNGESEEGAVFVYYGLTPTPSPTMTPPTYFQYIPVVYQHAINQ